MARVPCSRGCQRERERERERERTVPEAWGYAKHQLNIRTRLAPLTKALGIIEGNL